MSVCYIVPSYLTKGFLEGERLEILEASHLQAESLSPPLVLIVTSSSRPAMDGILAV